MRVEHRPVVFGDHDIGKGEAQPGSAIAVELVELPGGAVRDVRGEQPIAGARFEDGIVGRGLRQIGRQGSDIGRRRELLPLDLVFAAHGLGRERGGEPRGRADMVRIDLPGLPAQMHGCRKFEHLEALPLGPGSRNVGLAERGHHRGVQRLAVEQVASVEDGLEVMRGGGLTRAGELEEVGHGGLLAILNLDCPSQSLSSLRRRAAFDAAQSLWGSGGLIRRTSRPRSRYSRKARRAARRPSASLSSAIVIDRIVIGKLSR